MIKKKLSILLSLSLAVLFISLLGTTSYAKELTLNDVKNFCYNYYLWQYPNGSTVNLVNNLNSSETEAFLQRFVNSANVNQGKYILSGVNGYILYWQYDTNGSSYTPYYYNGVVYYPSPRFTMAFKI